ncbi:MAG TPA: DUF4129 domain-containing protein [Frankiaceae bacterium]|nr:DUF4129 domain-containing protein [Frankiaceae bacterium]
MRRLPALGLLVVGCALAAAAAGTGPYLGARDVEPPMRRLLDAAARERQRRLLQQPERVRSTTAFETFVEGVFAVAILVGVLYALVVFVRLLRRLVALRLRRSRGGVGTDAYDPGEESADDAETALRRRVADELTALSADLDTVPDPREAVIACYVRMERAFADAGTARRPDESPLELLARVLDALAVPEADVRRLTALFNEARFSGHPVTDEMRAAARRSLAAVAGALAVPA